MSQGKEGHHGHIARTYSRAAGAMAAHCHLYCIDHDGQCTLPWMTPAMIASCGVKRVD